MSTTNFLLDAASRRAVFVQRYSSGLEQKYSKVVEDILSEAIKDVAVLDLPVLSQREHDELRAKIADRLRNQFNEMSSEIIDEAVEFAIDEIEFSQQMIEQSVKADEILTPSQAQIMDTALNTRMRLHPSVSIREALNVYGEKKTAQTLQIIKDGVNQPSQKTVQALKQILPAQLRQITSLVRTANNSISSSMRMLEMQTNVKLFEGYEWVSTLDGKTSLICIDRDGNVYEFKVVNPIPPAHWSCRSTIVPVVKKEFDLGAEVTGTRPAVGPRGVEQVGSNVSYGTWLKRQPKQFQDEVLGPTRAELFRSGKLTIDKFVEDSGRVYTLSELKSLNPLAFLASDIN